MRKLIGAFVIAAVFGTSNASLACQTPKETFVLYPSDFAFYPESLIDAYQKAQLTYGKLKAEYGKCQKELCLLEAKRSELQQRYGELSNEVQELNEKISQRQALLTKLDSLRKEASQRLGSCADAIKRWKSLPKSYVVKRGDTLWGISSKSFVYNDPWQWPLIYRANRSKIRNPHLIFPNENLKIPRDITCRQIVDARKQALKTPPPKGIKPRKMPVTKATEVSKTATDYFICHCHR